MKASPTVLARPAWYDRNPTPRHLAGEVAGVGPHSNTERWTYTVPAGKKAFVEILMIYVQRVTAAGTADKARAMIWYTISGGSTAKILQAAIWSNGVGDQNKAEVGQAMILNPGDTLAASTQDQSTGGACDYELLCKLTEFDA